MDKIYKIYKIQFPNKKVYIGQTYNTHKRWLEHLYEASTKNNLKVYKAMRKYHTTINDFSIIEDNILTQEEANAKERYYIAKFNSQKEGYNIGSGGLNGWQPKGEEHPKALLTDDELLQLRKIRHSKMYKFNEVFEFYKDRLSYSGFQKYWNYESRPEVGKNLDVPELRDYYKTNKENLKGENHFYSKLTNNEVIRIRDAYWVDGIKMKDIWQSYKDKYSLSGFRKVVLGSTYTNIPMPEKTFKCKKKKDWLSKDQVLFIKEQYAKGYTIMQIVRKWFPDREEHTISNIVHNKTYTDY